MKRMTAKIAVQIIGTLFGLLGVYLVFSSFLMPLALGEDFPWLGRAVFTVVPFIMGMYFIWVAYVAWFRFSPLAVRHVCGLFGFALVMYVMGKFHPANAAAGLVWLLALLALAVIALLGYRVLSRSLNHMIFRESRADVD